MKSRCCLSLIVARTVPPALSLREKRHHSVTTLLWLLLGNFEVIQATRIHPIIEHGEENRDLITQSDGPVQAVLRRVIVERVDSRLKVV